VDASTGDIRSSMKGIINEEGAWLQAIFSPDARHILSPSDDGSISVFRAADGIQVSKLKGHPKRCRRLAFHPK